MKNLKIRLEAEYICGEFSSTAWMLHDLEHRLFYINGSCEYFDEPENP